MLDSQKLSRSKCYFTSSILPNFINHEQPSLKKRPFCTVQQQTFNHSLNVLLPEEKAKTFEKLIENGIGTLRYSKVYMKLSEVIDGDFFNHYIKSGNILMLSEGRAGIDHVFSLCEGLLRLEIDKATFERMGLEGKPIPNDGREHVKARYAVELNLRLPSMLRGKKGFERIVWAFKNVLNHTITWLFCDLEGPSDGTGPISVHQPVFKEVTAKIETLKEVDVPAFPQEMEEGTDEDATEILEWLTLTMSCSPRVHHNDDIDPYLSRYRLATDLAASHHSGGVTTQDIVEFQWRGLVHPAFVQKILLATLKASGEDWFALSATAFDGGVYAFLQRMEHTMTWEYYD